MEYAAGLIALACLLVTQFSLLWYRLGRLEAKLDNHCQATTARKESEG